MEEVIRTFEEKGVRYLLIGGQAMRLHGMPRFSMDWDFFIPGRDEENLQRIHEALGDELDMPLITAGDRGENLLQTYPTRWGVLQFHLAVPGLPSFDECWDRRFSIPDECGIGIMTLCGADLLSSKMASNRAQDQEDIAFLTKKKELGNL